jgi:hypothetical protein
LKDAGIGRNPTSRWRLKIVIATSLLIERLGVQTNIISFEDVLRQHYGYDNKGQSRFDTLLSPSTQKKEVAALSKHAKRFVDFVMRFAEFNMTIVPVTSMDGTNEHLKPYVGFAMHKGPNGEYLSGWLKIQREKRQGQENKERERITLAEERGLISDSTRENNPELFAPISNVVSIEDEKKIA